MNIHTGADLGGARGGGCSPEPPRQKTHTIYTRYILNFGVHIQTLNPLNTRLRGWLNGLGVSKFILTFQVQISGHYIFIFQTFLNPLSENLRSVTAST